MQQVLSAILFISIIFFSCKKEYSCEGCINGNKPPIANAGTDQAITLPKDSVSLDGSASSDPDGTITSYKWTKITGPASANIAKPDSSKTIVKSLVAGVYRFELTVTDNGGLSAKDTVQILVDGPGNQPPVACAGADQTITLPANFVTLDGSCSADPDNNITTYAWTKISGPSIVSIVNASAAQTQVTNLVQGVYSFELKVSDAGRLFSKDTMQVTVNAAAAYTCGDSNRATINARLIPVGTLSQARGGIAMASAGNKLVIAGGYGFANSSQADIYDLTTQIWTTASLSEARTLIVAIGAGNKIFFAGGEIGDGTCPTKTVDIYDASTNTWSSSFLSIPGYGMAAALVGNKVLFSGGNGLFCGQAERATRVDIYNLATNTWSIDSLSDTRIWHAAVTVNNKVYFSGGATPVNPSPGAWGASNTIDIYDDATNSWSTSSLIEAKMYHAGVAVNGKIYWAGGKTGYYPNLPASCSVEIRNTNTGSSSVQHLSSPGWRKGVVKDNQIIFYGDDDKFDIYDVASDTWVIGILPVRLLGAEILSVNNTIYMAGGGVNGVLSDKVYRLEF